MTTLFIAITCWWLAQDRTIPIFDAGLHLVLVMQVYREIGGGHIGQALTHTVPYPPFTYLIGCLGILVGGVGVAPPIVAENLVFVTLLALGCYKLGRLAFGPAAGLLAVVFALGSPLIAAQFHVFMTDAPQTAMVAVSVWLIVSTQGYTQIGRCALAGVAVGLGMLTKEPVAIFVVGVVGVTLWRGGRRSARGFAVFAVVALAIALPWYIAEINQIKALGNEVSSASSSFNAYRIPDVAPPRFSPTNLEWYLWSMINTALYLPLLLFATVGWVWAIVALVRCRPVSPLLPELLIGAFVSWALLTETFIHDERYGLPLLIYLAVFGSGWIVALRGRGRIVATSAIILVAVANTLGIAFGVGKEVKVVLPGAVANTLQQPGTVTLIEDTGFLASAPRRDGDLLAVLQALRRTGVRRIYVIRADATQPDFSEAGVFALSMIAGLEPQIRIPPASKLTGRDVTITHGPQELGFTPPCVTLDDGTGVWLQLGDPEVPEADFVCPLPTRGS